MGVVTTVPEFRRMGLATSLLTSLQYLAEDMGAAFIYLQGIPEFYNRLGYQGFASKSKFIFNVGQFKKRQGKLREMTTADIKNISEIFESYTVATSGGCDRSKADWSDLIGSLSSTFLFYKPQVILDIDNSIIGYFCSSPNDIGIIREFVSTDNPDLALKALSIVAEYFAGRGYQQFEIFSPDEGPISALAREILGADFIRYLRPRSSNMVKFFLKPEYLENLRYAFIYQGDNL